MSIKTKCLFSFLLLVGCSRAESDLDRWMSDTSHLRVVSTIGMIDDLVAEVGGAEVSHLCLINGALDPHSYELVKGDGEKLACADLIFCNGLGLEHGASLHRYLKDSDRVVSIGDAIGRAVPNSIIYSDGQIDPHIWMDVSLWKEGALIVAEALGKADPLHAYLYRSRGESIRKHLTKVDLALSESLATVPDEQRYLVSSHDAFHYFARRYLGTDWSERCIAPEGLSPEGQLSVCDIRNVIDQLEKRGIAVIFAESNLSQDAIRKIVYCGNERGLKVRIADEPLYGDAMGEAQTYEEMMLHNGHVIATNLLRGSDD